MSNAQNPHDQSNTSASSLPQYGRLLAVLEWGMLALGVWAPARPDPALLSVGGGLLAASWLARWARQGRLTKPTPLDPALSLFGLSAVAGVWAAPNPTSALPRLALFLGAVSVYYAVANSAGTSLRLAALGLVAAAAATAAAWLAGSGDLHRNDVAGLQLLALPAAIALIWEGARARNDRSNRTAGVAGAAAGLALLVSVPAVLLSQARTAGLAAAAALGVAGWWLAARRLSGERARPRRGLGIFLAGLGVAAATAAVGLVWQPQWLAAGLRALPGEDPTTGFGRLVVAEQAWRLAQATPFTGGGLSAFPALYSTYVHDIPHFLLAHAHNAYLNLLVEQGWPGLGAFVLALASAGWLAVRRLAQPPAGDHALLVAGAAGLVIVAVHGLGDATFVATWAAPAMLAPAGLVAASASSRAEPAKRTLARAGRAGGAAALAAAVVLLGVGAGSLTAAWQANLGAVAMGRGQLADWPTGQWPTRDEVAALAASRLHLQAALSRQPENFTALYYLGRQARQAQDFELAAAHLERALRLDPDHRGVVKTLGYTYVWLGQLEAAQTLLTRIPEARSELRAYSGWWGRQGRPDLADKALLMLKRLGP